MARKKPLPKYQDRTGVKQRMTKTVRPKTSLEEWRRERPEMIATPPTPQLGRPAVDWDAFLDPGDYGPDVNKGTWPNYNQTPSFIPDPNMIGPMTEEQSRYMNQRNEWQNNIRSTMRPGPVGIRKEGGEILNSFKSAARFDQKSYKKSPGRRNKG